MCNGRCTSQGSLRGPFVALLGPSWSSLEPPAGFVGRLGGAQKGPKRAPRGSQEAPRDVQWPTAVLC
eukprot:7068635-Pyramimonas_sp.AAC.1